MGKFVVKKDAAGEFRFNLLASNGQVILSSEGYTSRAGCDNGIESVKKNSPDDSKYDRKESTNGKYFFNLKATNGQVIGTSQMYQGVDGRDNGIESVKKNAPDAPVEDQLDA